MTRRAITSKPMLGMVSSQEREYLQEFAKSEYSGQGEIVDLGCWLGASTIALAIGLKGNLNLKAKESIIHAYDIFVWEAWMNQFVVDTPLEGKYKPGDSFFDECLERTLTWKNQIQFHPGDLKQLGWNGGAIELLFIDAMKSWDLANSIIHDFFPALIPGLSVVVHQDFAHYGTYWIHLIMYRLRHYFEPIYDIPHSWSFAFKYREHIRKDLLQASYSLSSFSKDEINSAFEYSSQLVSTEKQCQIVGAKVMALMHLGDTYQAHLELEKAISEGMSYADLDLPLGIIFPAQIVYFCLSKEAELERSQSQLHQIKSRLELTQGMIEAMESSKFWKLRTQWVKIKKILGLGE